MKKLFHLHSLRGRIRRLEYGLTLCFLLVYFVGLTLIDATSNLLGIKILLILIVIGYWILFAQSFKRCHDRGNSGWYQFIPFYIFWMLFANSEYGENEYGPNPKGVGNRDIAQM